MALEQIALVVFVLLEVSTDSEVPLVLVLVHLVASKDFEAPLSLAH